MSLSHLMSILICLISKVWSVKMMEKIGGEVRRRTSLSVIEVTGILALTCILITACSVAVIDYGEVKDENPIWSPNGHQIAFVSYYASPSPGYYEGPFTGPFEGFDAFSWTEICLMDADGANRRRLTDNAVPDRDPDWSPDGSSIVFASRRGASPIQGGSDRQKRLNFDIYVMDINSGEQINITSHPADDKHPHWSPDERLIAYVSNRDGSNNGDVFTMKPDGTDVTRWTSVGWVTSLDWSPDAKRLVFHSISDGDGEIYVLNLEDDSLLRLTDNEEEDTRPVWSPDSRSIVFVSDRDGSNQIYVMKLETMSVTPISSGTDASWGAAWSPNGRLISYVARRGANAQLHVWDSVENKLLVVAEDLAINGQTPRWSPDGQSLVYTRDEDLNHDGYSEEKIWTVRKNGIGIRRLSPDGIDE